MVAVHDLNLTVQPGKISALLGANGAGKSSTLMGIAGHVSLKGGQIRFKGEDFSKKPPEVRVAAGIGLVPEGRRLFAELTVHENLTIGGYCRAKDKTGPNMEKVLTLFPRLRERLQQRAAALSGGEQQMVAIGRALMSEPELLLVDELSLGLMPKAVDDCYAVLDTLKKEGLAIVVVEQSTQRVLDVADEVTVLESGRLVYFGAREELKNASDMVDAYLGLSSLEKSL